HASDAPAAWVDVSKESNMSRGTRLAAAVDSALSRIRSWANSSKAKQGSPVRVEALEDRTLFGVHWFFIPRPGFTTLKFFTQRPSDSPQCDKPYHTFQGNPSAGNGGGTGLS